MGERQKDNEVYGALKRGKKLLSLFGDHSNPEKRVIRAFALALLFKASPLCKMTTARARCYVGQLSLRYMLSKHCEFRDPRRTQTPWGPTLRAFHQRLMVPSFPVWHNFPKRSQSSEEKCDGISLSLPLFGGILC